MSLKAFHLVFVVLSALMLAGVLAWAVVMYLRRPSVEYLAYGALCLGGAAGLVAYGKYFLRKLKGMSYL